MPKSKHKSPKKTYPRFSRKRITTDGLYPAIKMKRGGGDRNRAFPVKRVNPNWVDFEGERAVPTSKWETYYKWRGKASPAATQFYKKYWRK